MPVSRAQKAETIEALNKTFSDNEIVVVCHFTGLTVAEITDLRVKLRAEDGSFTVTKNRLAQRAVKGTRYEGLDTMFKGPTGIAVSRDPVAAARVAYDFAKTNDKLVILGGALGDKILDKTAMETLAQLPSLDALRGKIVGILQAPATKIAGVLQAPARDLVGVTKAYSEKAA